MTDQPAGLYLGIDLGTTTITVSWQWSNSELKHLLKFNSPYTEKTNEELDATLARSRNNWYYGLDVRYLSDVITFENIKLGIIGQEPYTNLLKESFRAANQKHRVTETPVTLFRNLYLHILDTLAAQFLDPNESQSHCGDRNFSEIQKHCWVTYPVRHSESLKITLVEAALAAGFDGVNGVSESLAAACFVAFHAKHAISSSRTMLIIDCGGGSTDAATVYIDGDGRIKQACPTDGFNGGGHMINHVARDWLQDKYPNNDYLRDDKRWMGISSQFEGCKRVFDGTSSVKVDVMGDFISIDCAEMANFFQPLISNILDLFHKQYQNAEENGHAVGDFVLCGGPARNHWFAKTIFDLIQKSQPGITCAAEVLVGTVANGALSYARRPVTEVSLASEDIGLTYLETHSASGVPLGGDRVEEAIGLLIEKGQPAGRGSHVELMKTVYRDRTDRANRIVSSKAYRTTPQFDRRQIRANDRIEWDCRIIYPLKGLRSHLHFLGCIEAEIPHEILFPAGSSHDRKEAYFIVSIKPEGQLLKVGVSLKRDGDTPLVLRKSYVPAASWAPESELDLEGKQYGDSMPFPPGGVNGAGRKRKRSVPKAIRPYSPRPVRTAMKPGLPSASYVHRTVAEKKTLPARSLRTTLSFNASSASEAVTLPTVGFLTRPAVSRHNARPDQQR